MSRNLFFAHPKAMEAEEIDERLRALRSEEARAYLLEEFGVDYDEAVSGHDHYHEHAVERGLAWDEWQECVVEDHDLLVLPNNIVGKATMQIVRGVLDKGGTVLWWPRADELLMAPVIDVVERDVPRKPGKGPSWIDGWELVIEAEEGE